MRLFATIAIGTLAVTSLSACGESDDAFKAGYRTRMTQACTQANRGPGGADAQQLCNCMVERYVANTPVDQLRAEKDQTQMPAAAQQAMMQCTQEHLQRRMGSAAPNLNNVAVPDLGNVSIPQVPQR